MTLTERAKKYLNKLERINEYNLDRETTIDYFNQQAFPLNEKFIEIQTNFSGYKLTIAGDREEGFLLRLFSKTEVRNNSQIDTYHIGKTCLVYFGDHDTAQFHFYITNLGELCTLGYRDDDTPNIICSSIEKFVEQYALQNELVSQAKNPYYYNILNNQELIKTLEQSFTKIEECSDKYSQWFTNGQLTIDIGTWLDRPEFYLHVYGQTRENCDKFIDNLKQFKIIV